MPKKTRYFRILIIDDQPQISCDICRISPKVTKDGNYICFECRVCHNAERWTLLKYRRLLEKTLKKTNKSVSEIRKPLGENEPVAVKTLKMSEEIEKLDGVSAPASANLRIIPGRDISISDKEDVCNAGGFSSDKVTDKFLNYEKRNRQKSAQNVF